MTIAYERQQFRALALLPIRELPDYGDDATVVCRVAKAVSIHANGGRAWDTVLQKALELSVRRPFGFKLAHLGKTAGHSDEIIRRQGLTAHQILAGPK